MPLRRMPVIAYVNMRSTLVASLALVSTKHIYHNRSYYSFVLCELLCLVLLYLPGILLVHLVAHKRHVHHRRVGVLFDFVQPVLDAYECFSIGDVVD